MGPFKPYISVLEPKLGSNPEDWNWRMEGWFAEVWFEIQVSVLIKMYLLVIDM